MSDKEDNSASTGGSGAPTSPSLQKPSPVEIKKSPLAERRKIPGYQLTQSEEQLSSDVTALARELQRAVSTVWICYRSGMIAVS